MSMTPVPAGIVERLRRLDRLLAQAVEDSDGNWEDTVTDLGFVMTALLVSHDNAEHRVELAEKITASVMQAARYGLILPPAQVLQ